ncbi:Potassium channel SKOR, partial [Linum perenne]
LSLKQTFQVSKLSPNKQPLLCISSHLISSGTGSWIMARKKENKEEEEEHEVDDLEVRDRMSSSTKSRFNLIIRELGLYTRTGTGESSTTTSTRRMNLMNGYHRYVVSKGLVIHPDNRLYRAWSKFILVWAVYSSFFTPMEFGFFRGLPNNLFILDIVGQIAFLLDIILQFFISYRDPLTYRMVYNLTPIALRYFKSHFIIDFLGCLPWDIIYKVSGHKEAVRYLTWIRLWRVRRVIEFFHHLEKDIRINYLFTRIIKLIAVELYCTHTAACIFYYLATTLPQSEEGYTWIGSLKLGDYSYSHFRDIDIWKRYTTSLYFAIVTMATVGYGDIHAVNLREMIFVMMYVSFDMILGAYLIGNMTALIVKGSKTEKYRDKMTDLIKYMNRNRLGRDIRNQVKGHLRLQYEHRYTEASVLQEIPISIRAKAVRLHEEFFLPGEVILEQGSVVDQLYFVCQGALEEVGMGEDESEETVKFLQPNSSFGQVSILCNIPQPYTVRVCELCRLLRLDKQSFLGILEIYFNDGRKILNNILESESETTLLGDKKLESDITFHIGKQEAELALRLNNAAYNGDLFQLKAFIRAGADPNRTDYDGRSPLHLAASRGYEDMTSLLLQKGVDVNMRDKSGNTPLMEAIKSGHDRVATLLVQKGASLNIEDAGSFLCTAVARGESDFLKRILANGVDPNSKDYDHRTPLHVAASQGLYLMAKLLVDAGASVFTTDRWGNTALDEGRKCGSKNMINLLEDAKSTQLTEMPQSSRGTENLQRKKCTVFPFHPWLTEEDKRRVGIVMWVPDSIEELIREAATQLLDEDNGISCIIVTQDGGRIMDVAIIDDSQKLFLIHQT